MINREMAQRRILVLPFASIGGVFALFVRGECLSVPASVGFIALWGIAVLNGVVLVSYIRGITEPNALTPPEETSHAPDRNRVPIAPFLMSRHLKQKGRQMTRKQLRNCAAALIAVAGLAAGQPLTLKQEQTQANIALRPAGEIQSGIVPPQCKPFVDKGPRETETLLNCYLTDPSNSLIASSMTWVFNGVGGQWAQWAQWPAWAKSDLVAKFADTVAWYKGGMVKYPGTLVVDPPPIMNMQYLTANNFGATTYDEATVAWPLYVGHVALSLASEIYGWVPWSLHNYTPNDIGPVLSYQTMFWPCNQYGASGFCPTPFGTPTNAIYVFKFFKTNNLIGATKMDTIARVLDWSRQNLWHTGGAFTYQQMFYYFQYYGGPPVSRIIEGTVTTDPFGTPDDWKIHPHHWTAGCSGSSSFFAEIFRAVSIPVSYVSPDGGHISPYFDSEKMYLSHGDDPYSGDAKSDAPAKEFLINAATYQTWFPVNDPITANHNVGRQNYELNLKYTSEWVLDLYCYDQANAKDHASGKVYNEYFKKYYPLNQVEAAGVWTRLDQKIASHGCAM